MQSPPLWSAGTPDDLKADLSALLGKENVLHRAIDLVRYASDASPYRLVPHVGGGEDGKALLGCRVPTLIVSPFSRGNPTEPRINSSLYDHTSVLKMIEWRWGLTPLTARDASTPAGETVVDSTKALQIAQIKHDSGERNEAYDFYLLLNCEHMQGWTTVPQGLKEK